MAKLFLGIMTAALFATGAALAQTAATKPSNEQNPEATCPVGANCAPQAHVAKFCGPEPITPCGGTCDGNHGAPEQHQKPGTYMSSWDDLLI